MKKIIVLVFVISTLSGSGQLVNAIEIIDRQYPIGTPGLKLTYGSKVKVLPGSVVGKLELTVGAVEEENGIPYRVCRTYKWLNGFVRRI